MSSSSSPCAACKFLRRKCTQGCVFAPYFPPDQPHKFAHVHRVFGASNVAKLLNDLPTSQREDAVNSLAYEAEARLRDPVYGCVRYISLLQTKLKEVQVDLYNAKKELAAYIGPSASSASAPFFAPQLGFTVPNSIAQFGLGPILQQHHHHQQQHQPQSQQLVLQQPVLQQHQQQLAEQQQQQALFAARENEIMMMRFNGLYGGREQQVGFASSSSSQELAEDQLNLHHQQQQHHHHHQQQQQFVEQQQQQQQQGLQNEEGRSGAGQ